MKKLDYSLTTTEERLQLVNEIISEEGAKLNSKYLEILADYLIIAATREDRKKQKLITENKMTTINKREMSFEGLVETFENGEDGVYNIIANDKNIIFQPKVEITKQDLDNIPFLRSLREAVDAMAELQTKSTGRDAYLAKQALIELRKDQYVIKNAYLVPIMSNKLTRSIYFQLFPEQVDVVNQEITFSGATLIDPDIVEFLLCHYSSLKEGGWSNFNGDLWYLMEDFDKVAEKALAPYPVYDAITTMKIDGRTNKEIKIELQVKFGLDYSPEYISSLWRNKIPKIIATQEKQDYLEWYYTAVKKGYWKKCSRCGQVKLAHSEFFSVNEYSKDGYYSICKCCRNRKKKN
jgi:hypothetical protein